MFERIKTRQDPNKKKEEEKKRKEEERKEAWEKEGSIKAEFLAEFLDQTVEKTLKSGNTTVRKLLTDKRFMK